MGVSKQQSPERIESDAPRRLYHRRVLELVAYSELVCGRDCPERLQEGSPALALRDIGDVIIGCETRDQTAV